MTIVCVTRPDKILNQQLIWRKILEVKQMKHQIREETWPIIDQFFQEMPDWLDQIVLANELAEIDFKIPSQNQASQKESSN